MIRAVLVFMALFFVIGMLFITLSSPMETMYNVSYDLAESFDLPQSEVDRIQEHQTNIINTWYIVPFIMLIALVIWLFVQSQKREYEVYPQY